MKNNRLLILAMCVLLIVVLNLEYQARTLADEKEEWQRAALGAQFRKGDDVRNIETPRELSLAIKQYRERLGDI